MQGEQFRKWAELAARVYAGDPWAFLRELAQNARDASATRVDIEAGRTPDGKEVVRFSDDGSGMTREHARRYLFRLYSSSKEGDPRSAGMYGIGFWAVLGFGPESVEVQSRSRGRGWGIRLNERFDAVESGCRLKRHGTVVTLVRPAAHPDEESFLAAAQDAVERFCRYLRRNDRRGSPLPVWFRGRQVTRPLSLGGPVRLSFRRGKIEGVVGLASQPRVELLARGLPVWHGSSIEELRHSARRVEWKGEVAQGLAPVFLLNGNDLDVILSRNAVVDNAALARVRRTARAALERLVRKHVQAVAPAGLLGRLGDLTRRAAARLGQRGLAAVVAVVLVAAAVAAALWYGQGVTRSRPPDPSTTRGAGPALPREGGEDLSLSSGPPPSTADAVRYRVAPLRGSDRGGPGESIGSRPAPAGLLSYHGADVDGLPPAEPPALTWSPRVDAWFRVLSAARFSVEAGFVPLESRDEPAPRYRCPGSCLDVSVLHPAGGVLSLPVPTGYAVEAESVRVDARVAGLSFRPGTAQWNVVVPPAAQEVSYRCGPAAAAIGAESLGPEALPPLPEMTWPTVLQEQLDLAQSGLAASEDPGRASRAVAAQAAAAYALVRGLVAYDRSVATWQLYASRGADEPWLPFVLEAGRGDCDVMNGLAALALRGLDVPARVAVGYVGAAGKLRPGLHAWTEYFDQGRWIALDVSAAPLPPPMGGGVPREQGERGAEGGNARAAPVPPPSPPPSAGEGRVGGTPLPQLLALVVLALGLLSLGAYLLLRPRWQERMEGAEDPAEAEALLAKMAAAALAVPAAWRGTTELMRHRLLPRVGGKRVSIARAERLGREGRLFIGSGSRRLAALAGSRGACVLDREGRLFRTLMEGMSGAVDLDEVEGLGCVLPGSADEPALLRHANRVLAGRCGSRVALVAARASVQELRDVDLRNARLPRACGWPGQLVALGTSSAFLAGCAREHRVQPQIAVFKLLDRVTGESWLLRPDASRIRYLAACALIEEGSA